MKRAWGAVAVGIAILVALWLRAGDPEAPARDAAPHAAARAETGSSAHRTAPLATISGRVTRADTKTGLAGATVTFASDKQSSYEDPPLVVVVAGGDGAWTAPIPTGTYDVAASAEGFLPTVVEGVVVAPGARVDTALVAGGSVVTGIVTDLGGGPVENARVSVTQRGAVVQSVTRGDGRYRLTLPDDTYYPRVHPSRAWSQAAPRRWPGSWPATVSWRSTGSASPISLPEPRSSACVRSRPPDILSSSASLAA